MNYSVGLYIRLSKEDESVGQSESVLNQLSLLTAYAKEHGLSVFDTYIDDGWSGTTFDRPAFRRLIDDIELKHVNMVITKDLSRLGRDYILTGHYMERYFPENRVRFISLLDGIDTAVENSANDITPFRALLNDMYSKDISKKIKSVKQDKQKKGLFIGGKPLFGYKMGEKNKIVIDENASPLVRRIFGLALQGISCRQIAAQLNREQIPTPARYADLTPGRRGPYSGTWSSERISDMLQNETYIGNMVQGRSRKLSYKSKRCVRQPREDWIVVEGTHEPIIGKDAFEKVQQLLKSRKTTRSRTYDYLLKGLIYCHECGYPLAVINRKNAKGEDCLYFVCRTYQRFTKAGVCTCHSVKEETVTQAVISKVRQVCENNMPTEVLLFEAKKAVEEAPQMGSRAQTANSLKAKKESLTALLDQIYMDRQSGFLDEPDFERIYRKTKLERTALEQKLAELAEPDHKLEKQDELPTELVNRFIEDAWSNRALLVSLLEKIELTEDKQILIHFRFCQPEGSSLSPPLTIDDTSSIPY